MKSKKPIFDDKKHFLQYASEIGMDPNDLNKTFVSKNVKYELVGLAENKKMVFVRQERMPSFKQFFSIQEAKDRLAGIPEPIPEPTEWEIRQAKFNSLYNDETTTSTPWRCVVQTDGYYTRKDGQVCTEEDVKLLYELRELGQNTEFTLEDGKVKVYGFCDSSD